MALTRETTINIFASCSSFSPDVVMGPNRSAIGADRAFALNADYGVVEELAVPRRRGVLQDQVIIAILLVKYLQLKSAFGWSLSNLVALLRQQRFVYRDLWPGSMIPFSHRPYRKHCQSNWRYSFPNCIRVGTAESTAHSQSRVTTIFQRSESRQHPINRSTSEWLTCPRRSFQR